jgi:DNA-binding NtrC family response regulator
MDSIKTYHWPGNIRQLANTIERAAILEEGDVIQEENMMIPEPIKTAGSPPDDAIPESLEMGERAHILRALKENLWIQKDAARDLGISPRTLNYKIKKYQITHHRWRKHK